MENCLTTDFMNRYNEEVFLKVLFQFYFQELNQKHHFSSNGVIETALKPVKTK